MYLGLVSLEMVDDPSRTNDVRGVAHDTAKKGPGAEDEAIQQRTTMQLRPNWSRKQVVEESPQLGVRMKTRSPEERHAFSSHRRSPRNCQVDDAPGTELPRSAPPQSP